MASTARITKLANGRFEVATTLESLGVCAKYSLGDLDKAKRELAGEGFEFSHEEADGVLCFRSTRPEAERMKLIC